MVFNSRNNPPAAEDACGSVARIAATSAFACVSASVAAVSASLAAGTSIPPSSLDALAAAVCASVSLFPATCSLLRTDASAAPSRVRLLSAAVVSPNALRAAFAASNAVDDGAGTAGVGLPSITVGMSGRCSTGSLPISPCNLAASACASANLVAAARAAPPTPELMLGGFTGGDGRGRKAATAEEEEAALPAAVPTTFPTVAPTAFVAVVSAPSACDRVAEAPGPSWPASCASRAGLVLAGGGGRSRIGLGGGTRASPGVSPSARCIRGPGSAPGFLGGVGGIP